MNSNKTDEMKPELIPLYTETDERAGTLIRYPDGSVKFSQDIRADRNVKDRLFRFIFGNPEHKEWTLALYNSVEHKNYTDVRDLDIVTLENAIYMHMKNDVSVLVDSWYLDFFEHQSTPNPNIPFRFLQYYGATMERYIRQHRLNRYGRTAMVFPVPRFYVFYNGKEETEKTKELRLSELYYDKEEEPFLDLKVIQHNINGIKKEDSEYCIQLYEYEWLVERIREYSERADITTAVELAISEMPEDFTIRGWIQENRSEVIEMSLFEYDEKEHMSLEREEGRAEGIREGTARGLAKGLELGKAEGRVQGIIKAYEMLVKLGISDTEATETIAEQYETDTEEIRKIISNR